MRAILVLIFLSVFCSLFARQSCGCVDELDFVIDYYEKNLASYSDNVVDENKAEYERFKEDLRQEARSVKNAAECFRVLTYYVEFFKDNHASIFMRSENIDENDEESVQRFLLSDIYKSREVYQLSEHDLKQYPIDDIRGIYHIGDVYEIAIIPSKTPFRDYVGVILRSSSKIWKRGQVKLELKKVRDNSYQAFSHMRNHSLSFSGRYKLKNGILGDTWIKSNKTDNRNFAVKRDSDFHFEIVHDSIAYLRISSFSGNLSAKIDSLYAVADSTIRRTPYLIIDVRDNGGGSDSNANPLLPYIYTNPIKEDKVELLVTKGNLEIWKNWKKGWEADSVNYSKEDVEWISNEVRMMERAKLNSWITRSKAGKVKINDASLYPKAVAIIQNQYCASSCETLLFWAKQSKKTILVGENSGGYVGYGENGGVRTPCHGFWLTCTMTRYEKQRAFEADGIAPDFLLEYDRDWMEQTIELLQNIR